MADPLVTIRLVQAAGDDGMAGCCDGSETPAGEVAIGTVIDLEMVLFRPRGCMILGHVTEPGQHLLRVRFTQARQDVDRPRLDIWSQRQQGRRKSALGLWRGPGGPGPSARFPPPRRPWRRGASGSPGSSRCTARASSPPTAIGRDDAR